MEWVFLIASGIILLYVFLLALLLFLVGLSYIFRVIKKEEVFDFWIFMGLSFGLIIMIWVIAIGYLVFKIFSDMTL